MDKYLGTFEVARLCRVSPGSVIRWVKEGKLQASMTGGGHHRIDVQDLIEFLKKLRLPVPPELQLFERKVTVLIVDDEPEVRTMIHWMVRQNFPEAIIEEAPDGFMAGWKVRELNPQLVTLDMRMPGINGLEVCRFMRSLPQLKDTKILGVSAYFDPETRQNFLNAGADDFLSKPFKESDLKEKILTFLNPNGKHLGRKEAA